MNPEIIENLIKLLTPVALAIAWIWTQIRITDKEEHSQKLDIGDREMKYAERLEKRLERAQTELETALQLLSNRDNAEELLKKIVAGDPGVMFLKRHNSQYNYTILKVSKGYAVLYLGGPSSIIEGSNESILGENYSENDEVVYKTQEGKMVREPVHSKLTGIKGTFVGRKFPVVVGDITYIIGVGDHEFD